MPIAFYIRAHCSTWEILEGARPEQYLGDMSKVTELLSLIEKGDAAAADQLLPLVYEELRRLAERKLLQEQPGQTLQATALVHEAYLRLVDGKHTERWDSVGHFFAAAAESMRRILVERARAKGRKKRHGGRLQFRIDDVDVAFHTAPDQLLAIDEAIEKLRREDPEVFELVRLRYFAGFTVPQAAAAIGVSTATGYRYWNYARAWLHSELLGTDDA